MLTAGSRASRASCAGGGRAPRPFPSPAVPGCVRWAASRCRERVAPLPDPRPGYTARGPAGRCGGLGRAGKPRDQRDVLQTSIPGVVRENEGVVDAEVTAALHGPNPHDVLAQAFGNGGRLRLSGLGPRKETS